MTNDKLLPFGFQTSEVTYKRVIAASKGGRISSDAFSEACPPGANTPAPLQGQNSRHHSPAVLTKPGSKAVHVFVHLAAQLVFSLDMIASHRFTKSDHCSAESAFTSPVLAISALSRRAVAR